MVEEEEEEEPRSAAQTPKRGKGEQEELAGCWPPELGLERLWPLEPCSLGCARGSGAAKRLKESSEGCWPPELLPGAAAAAAPELLTREAALGLGAALEAEAVVEAEEERAGGEEAGGAGGAGGAGAGAAGSLELPLCSSSSRPDQNIRSELQARLGPPPGDV